MSFYGLFVLDNFLSTPYNSIILFMIIILPVRKKGRTKRCKDYGKSI